MNHKDRLPEITAIDLGFTDSESAWESSVLASVGEPAHFLNQYRSFDLDAISEAPKTLDPFIDYQHLFDL